MPVYKFKFSYHHLYLFTAVGRIVNPSRLDKPTPPWIVYLAKVEVRHYGESKHEILAEQCSGSIIKHG